MASASAPDSPWTTRLKSSKAESVDSAVLSAKQAERDELERRVTQLEAVLPPSLGAHKSAALKDLVELHRELGLHPTDVNTPSLLAQLDKLSQSSTELELDLICARQALVVLTNEQSQSDTLKQDLDQLQQTLTSSRPASTDSAHEDSVLQTKIDGYVREKAKLEARLERDGLADISSLLERTEHLDELERENEQLKREVSKFKGLPADYELAKLKVEEERRALRERQVLRDDAMAAAFT